MAVVRAPSLHLSSFLQCISHPRPRPAVLASCSTETILPAQSWFLTPQPELPPCPPLQFESYSPQPDSSGSSRLTFTQPTLPIEFFNAYLKLKPPADVLSLYLAQTALPDSWESSFPAPSWLEREGDVDLGGTSGVAGRGEGKEASDDLLGSTSGGFPSSRRRIGRKSVWIGLTETNTPLHCDPEHNFLLQLAGRKVVRLVSPSLGERWIGRAVGGISSQRKARGMGQLRGEEMMDLASPEYEKSQRIWESEDAVEAILSLHAENDDRSGKQQQDVIEAVLDQGMGLFIPRGWWHAVKGVAKDPTSQEREVNASVNWWFS
ncbi:Clavaminate synthase-like protein [Meredithblackwellia eburnea MCA 4105]